MKLVCSVLLGFILCGTLGGCATILSGRTQTITVQSNPPGARCELVRQGMVVGSVEQTPGAVTLQKTKDDINVVCNKPGFGEAKSFAESGTDGMVYGNILLGGLIGWGVDSAAGTDNKYPDVVTVNLASTTGANATDSNDGRKAVAIYSEDINKKLRTLKRLRDDGLLTDSEYKAKRAEILRGL